MCQDCEQFDVSGVLEPCTGPVYRAGSVTPRSRLSNALVAAFLASGAASAAIRHEQTPYGLGELYDGVRNVCRKKGLRRVVAVSKRGGRLHLRRLAAA